MFPPDRRYYFQTRGREFARAVAKNSEKIQLLKEPFVDIAVVGDSAAERGYLKI